MSNLGIFLTVFFDHCATYLHSENTVRSITKLDQIEHFGLSKKAAMISNFYLIGKIHHNFLVPKMIEDFHAYSDLRSTQSDLLYILAKK